MEPLGYKIANDFRMARMLRGLYTNPKLVCALLAHWYVIRESPAP